MRVLECFGIVPDVDPTDHWRYMVHFVLRFSFAIFIETFAYFFLRLYRNSLDDIKYYQNEITNIEARWGAMRVARDTNDKALMKIALEGLSKTERDAVLKKGETTIGLERDRLDKNEIMELFRAALGIGRRNKQDD